MRSVRVILILVLVMAVIGHANPTNGKPPYDLNDAPALFQKFIKDYNRHFKDADDYKLHYDAFYESLVYINRLNAIYGSAGRQPSIFTLEEEQDLFGSINTVIAMASAAPTSDKPHYDLSNAEALFEQFIKDFERAYKDEADRQVHFRAFVQSLEKINKLNEQSSSATFGINKFADYTEEERKGMFGLRKQED